MNKQAIKKSVLKVLWVGLGGLAAWHADQGAWAGLVFWFMLSLVMLGWQFIAVMKGEEEL